MSHRTTAFEKHQQTVVERKQQFLQSRKHQLSRGIVPSEKLKRIAQDGGIALSELKGVLDKVNRDLKQHSRSVYSRQMTEHVVEQIDKYYWSSGARDIDAEDLTDAATDMADDDHTVYQHDDLTQDVHIAKLRPRWDTSADLPSTVSDTNNQVDQDDYLDALTRLQDLSARRLMLQQKLSTYKTLSTLLEPYSNPKASVQPNLVGKDAPIANELAKTRTLAIRVIGRVEERFGDVLVPGTAEDDDVEMAGDDPKGRVDKVLASW